MMNVSGIYALATASTKGENFSTSAVNIKLEEFTLNDENKEVKYVETNRMISPGEEISIIPKISNLGADCYIRVQGLFLKNNTEIENGIKGISDNWQKNGDYYYYNSVVQTGETIEFFRAIKIPENLSNDSNDDEIKLKVSAEAVQAKNFEPDYTLEDPWHGVEVEKAVDDSYSISGDENDSNIVLKYENNCDKDITVPNGLFKDLSQIMPGDVIKHTVTIKNNNKISTKYYLNIENNKLSDTEKEMLSKLTLKITNSKEKEIYNGNLLNVKDIKLGEYSQSEEDKLVFEIDVPKDLSNKYSASNPNMVWEFLSEDDDKKEDQNKNTDKNSNTSNETKPTGKTETQKETSKNPKTGDFEFDLSLILFFISATGLIIVLVLEYRERRIKK